VSESELAQTVVAARQQERPLARESAVPLAVAQGAAGIGDAEESHSDLQGGSGAAPARRDPDPASRPFV